MPGKEWEEARERYAAEGVDAEAALKALSGVKVSLNCWQGDDVGGFEKAGAGPLDGGGLKATGNYPGRARTPGELRSDMEKALSLVPGTHRVNLHAIYGEFGGKAVDRDAIGQEHFEGWVEWAGSRKLAIDFNATLFAHPKAASGYTLSDRDKGVRRFWIEHSRRCREIGAWMGGKLDSPCIHNLWIPDGSKDATSERYAFRARLRESLDAIYGGTGYGAMLKDAVEPKLFGIGSESFVVGSHEFYLAYAISRKLMPCFDMGHFHPTESVADKVSAVLPFTGEMLVHISRGVRWDSDHVAIFDDNLRELAAEAVRTGKLERIHLALDYFDASINRVAAWVVGMRSTLKAVLAGLLEPHQRMAGLEASGDLAGRLALAESLKTMPFGAVWDEHCSRANIPGDGKWMDAVRTYEKDVLSRRT
jgi:L-rhamnose isomerase